MTPIDAIDVKRSGIEPIRDLDNVRGGNEHEGGCRIDEAFD
jgi:hypothetical protein